MDREYDEAMLTSTPDANSKDSAEPNRVTLRELFESEESGLLRFAFSLTGRRAVAEEIVQEVFLQLHAKWNEVNEPRPWLYRSVRNRAFHYLRKSRRESIDADSSDSESSESYLTQSPDVTPDELIAKMETVAELRQLVSQLPEKDQRLIQLKYFEDLKYRDISQRTGLTITNVGYRLHQVIRKLAAAMLSTKVEE